MPRLRAVTKSVSSATWRAPGVVYTCHSQTLCAACRRRVQWNGDRWIHLTVYARGMHEARPDLDLVVESDDHWLARPLELLELALMEPA
jgi:hypothetical protein